MIEKISKDLCIKVFGYVLLDEMPAKSYQEDDISPFLHLPDDYKLYSCLKYLN